MEILAIRTGAQPGRIRHILAEENRMTKTRLLIGSAIMACLVIGSTGIAVGDDSGNGLRTRLTGFQQVPAILSNGTGVLTASVGSSSLTYSLTFSNLSSSATAAHIHFGQ